MSAQNTAFKPAVLQVSWASLTYSVIIAFNGFGYSPGDVFLLKGTLFGGVSPQNDLVLTPTVSQTGVVVTIAIQPGSVAPAGTGTISLSYDNSGDKAMRDASDITRRIKERLIYLERQTGSPITSEYDPNIMQSNQYRLSYSYGKLKCGACPSGPFNQNGPIHRS